MNNNFAVQIISEDRPCYEEKMYLDTELEFIEEESNYFNKGDNKLALYTRDQVKEDIELCLVDSALGNVLENGYGLNSSFVLNGNIYTEEEMASVLDLTELFISNQSSYAIKMLIIDRLKVYMKFKFDLNAVIDLVKSVLANIDAQLGYDESNLSLSSNFDALVSQNIYYRDINELELSALMWINLNEKERMKIQKEIFKIQKNDFLHFDHSKSLSLDGIDVFQLIVRNKNPIKIQDLETNLYLSSLEIEFEKFISMNSLLLNDLELVSVLELAELMIINHRNDELLKESIKAFAKQKYLNGEHIISIFKSTINILKKAELNLDFEWFLGKELNRIAFENYFDIIDNEIKFSLINEICMSGETKKIIQKELRSANFKHSSQKGYLASEYSNSTYNEYIFKEEFLFKVFTNQEAI